MKQNSSYFEEIINQLGFEITVYDPELKIHFMNPGEEPDSILRKELIGQDDYYWCRLKQVNESVAKQREEQIRIAIDSRDSVEFEEEITYNNGDAPKYFIRTITPIFDSKKNLVKIIRQGIEITDRKRIMGELEFLANHDPMTGLPNRRLLYHSLDSAILKENRGNIYVFLLDLDRFKTINDTLGHMIGDTLIKSVCLRLKNLYKNYKDVIISRLGGDEFVVVFTGMSDKESAHSIAKMTLGCFEAPFLLAEHELFVTTSIGIYIHSENDSFSNVDDIIKKADIAMYKAKDSGRNKYKIYEPGMNTKVVDIFSLETKLNKAFKQKDFKLYFQPRIDSGTANLKSLEVLLRWVDDNKIVSSGSFFETAEESGILLFLTPRIFREAIDASKRLYEITGQYITMSINISERQFNDESLLDTLTGIIHETGFDPRHIDLELKENIIMKNPDNSIETLQAIRNKGINIVLDDFGSGYSSLGKFKDYPIDIISIDKSIVKGVSYNYQDAAITSAIVSMAHQLDIKVNAEGIENDEQLFFFRYLRCNLLQGNFLSRPLPFEELEKIYSSKKISDFKFFDETVKV